MPEQPEPRRGRQDPDESWVDFDPLKAAAEDDTRSAGTDPSTELDPDDELLDLNRDPEPAEPEQPSGALSAGRGTRSGGHSPGNEVRLDRGEDADPYEVDLLPQSDATQSETASRAAVQPGDEGTSSRETPQRRGGQGPAKPGSGGRGTASEAQRRRDDEDRMRARGVEPPTAKITRDLACVVCGYNLRNQPRGGLCPECATPVKESIGGLSHLMDAPIGYLQRLRQGAICLGIASLLLVTAVVVGPVLAFTGFTAGAPIVTTAVVFLIGGLLWVAGSWIITQRVPGEPASEFGPLGNIRSLARWSVIGGVAVQTVVSVFELLDTAVGLPAAVLQIGYVLEYVAFLLLAAGVWFTCLRLSDLASWFQDVDTAGAFDSALTGASIAILLGILGRFLIMLSFIGAILWLYTAFNYVRGTLTFMATVQAAVRDKPMHEARKKRLEEKRAK